jgi:hypothetical protein
MKKIIIGVVVTLVVLVLVVLIVAFFSLNSIVKKGIETAGPMITQVDVKVSAVAISPFSGSGVLTKFFVGNPPGYTSPSAVTVGEVKLAVQPSSLASDPIVINEISVKDAVITLEGGLSDNNITKIQANVKAYSGPSPTNATPSTAPPGTAKKIILNDFLIQGAVVNLILTVPVLGKKTMSVPLPTVHLQNIGKAENGVTPDQLVQVITKELLNQATKAATDQVTAMGGDFKDFGKGGADQMQKAAKSLTDMFKK